MSLLNLFKREKTHQTNIEKQARPKGAELIICPFEFEQICLHTGSLWITSMQEMKQRDPFAFARFMALPSHYMNRDETGRAMYYSALTEGRNMMLTSLNDLLSGRKWDDLTGLDLVDAVQNYYRYYEDGHFQAAYIEKARQSYPAASGRRQVYQNFLTELCNLWFSRELLRAFSTGKAAPVARKITDNVVLHQQLLDIFFNGPVPKISAVLYAVTEQTFVASDDMQADIDKAVGEQ